jgi:hypothetical protein
MPGFLAATGKQAVYDSVAIERMCKKDQLRFARKGVKSVLSS